MSIVLDGSGGITTNSGTVVSTTDATLNGLTVGKGGGAVSTNTAVGASALNANTTATNNTAVGYQASLNQTGGSNTAVGQGAFLGASGGSGTNNTSIGINTLSSNTTGSANTALGQAALVSNTSGSYNTSLGNQSLLSNTTASNIVAIGYQAGYNSTGGSNTIIGYQAGFPVTTGSGNVILGLQAGYGTTNLTTGSNNVLLGNGASTSAGGDINSIVITHNSVSGKGSSTGFINPNGGGVYQGNNSATWSITSDQRLKKNIVDNTEGLEIISQIRVRNFEYRTAEEVTELSAYSVIDKQGIQLGVIAQELQEVCGDCVKTESTGVMSVNQDNITWHMVNAIKDLKALVDAQAAEIAELKAKVV